MAGTLSGTQGPAVRKRGANVGEGAGATTWALSEYSNCYVRYEDTQVTQAEIQKTMERAGFKTEQSK